MSTSGYLDIFYPRAESEGVRPAGTVGNDHPLVDCRTVVAYAVSGGGARTSSADILIVNVE